MDNQTRQERFGDRQRIALHDLPSVEPFIASFYSNKHITDMLKKYGAPADQDAIDYFRCGMGVLTMQIILDVVHSAVEGKRTSITAEDVTKAIGYFTQDYPQFGNGGNGNAGPSGRGKDGLSLVESESEDLEMAEDNQTADRNKKLTKTRSTKR